MIFQLSLDDMECLINSDSLYLPSIYNDLYVTGNTMSGWNLSPAPSFFPDMPIFFFYMFITGNFIISILLYGLTQLGLISLGFLLVIKQFSKSAYTYLCFSHLFLILFILVELIDGDFGFSYYIISNSYHMSAFISALFCMSYTLLFYKTSNTIWLAILLSHGTLALMSDKLFIITFIIPAIMVFLFTGLFKNRIHSVVLLTSFCLTYYFGTYFFELIKNSQSITIPEPHKYLAYENIANSFNIMFDQLGSYLFSFSIRSTILIIAIVSFLLLGSSLVKKLIVFRKKGKEVFDSQFIVYLFFFLFSTFVFLAPALNGSYTGWDTLRYNFSAYIALTLLFPVLLFSRQKPEWLISKGQYPFFTLLVAFFTFLGVGLIQGKRTNPITYYPKIASFMDDFVEKEELGMGVGAYWDAKVITMCSKKNIKVFAAFEEMAPYYHATNQNWFYQNNDGSPAIFDFILAPNQNMIDNAEKYLGPISKTINTPYFIIAKTKPFRFNPETYLPYLVDD